MSDAVVARLEPGEGADNPVTFTVLARQVETVRGQCAEITRTLSTVDDALQMLSQGSTGQDWGGFGLVSLPIVASLRAAKGLVGQYVKAQTGVSLGEWTSLVSTASARFEAYLTRLEAVSALAKERLAEPGATRRPDEARADLYLLEQVGWETAAWKVVLGRVAQLGRVVDAILQTELPAEPETSPDEVAAPVSALGGLQRRLKEVQHRTVDRSGDVRSWVLHPFVDVRDRACALPGQVDTLSRSVDQLELFLELVDAELQVHVGRLAAAEGDLVRRRVEAAILLPELARSLAVLREEEARVAAYLDRLREQAGTGAVPAEAASHLEGEYRSRLERLHQRADELDHDVQRWRREGGPLLEQCQAWVGLQLEVLGARESVGEPVEGPRRRLLERERDRLEESRRVLASL